MNDSYFSGVAVLHGSPQQHIWSFVAGSVENYTSRSRDLCPCDTSYDISIHRLLVMITSVSQDTYGQGFLILMKYTHFILRTHSGMVMDVTPVVPAAHSIILHISPNTWTTLPLMILNYDCVVIAHHIGRI